MEIQAKIPGNWRKGEKMKKLLAILPLALAGCAQPQPTAPTKTIGGLLPAIRRHPGAGANAAGRQHPVQAAQRRNPR